LPSLFGDVLGTYKELLGLGDKVNNLPNLDNLPPNIKEYLK